MSLLGRIARGEQDAVDECIQHYGGLVWSLARRLSPSTSDAEDAVQEIFLSLWKNAAKFDASKASEKTFITMIARRRLIDRNRRTQRQPDLRPMPAAGEVAGSQHRAIENSAEAAMAARALEQLKPEQRRALELSIYYGMSHREIADRTETPLGTVKSHIARGLTLVRQALASSGGLSNREVLS
ncbi:MAG: sigma-70 family RNA polymerase sigma factor [Acidobacteriota bacterium]